MNRFFFVEDGDSDCHCFLIEDIVRVIFRLAAHRIRIYTHDRKYTIKVMDDRVSLLWDEYKRIMLIINGGLPLPEDFDEDFYYQDNPDHAYWKTTTEEKNEL